MTACIVGWAHTPFGKLDSETVESLIVRVADEALRDAGIAHGLRHVILRYFNADPLGRTGQSTRAATHLIGRLASVFSWVVSNSSACACLLEYDRISSAISSTLDNVKSSTYYPQASKWIATRCQEFMRLSPRI